MGDPIRIRAKARDGWTEVLVLMPHPMETGLRLDATGQPVAAHHITDVQIAVADRIVLAARLSFAVAKDPMLSFHFKGGEPGATLRVHWTDNLGDERSDEVRIA